MNRGRYPELFQFFAGYFHEDWPVEAATADETIETFIRSHPWSELAHLADLIEAFAAEVPDDQSLERALFEELGCYYVPAADARSARSWLQYVSCRLRSGR